MTSTTIDGGAGRVGTMGTVRLRAATAADVEVCLAVQRDAAVAGYAHIFPPAEHPFPGDVVRAEWVARLAGDAQVVLAVKAGRVVGTVSARPPWLETLFVAPSHWGTGVAGELHDEALRLIAAAGAPVAHLDVMTDNRRARRFYDRRGWRPDGRTATSPFPPYPTLLGYRREVHGTVETVTPD